MDVAQAIYLREFLVGFVTFYITMVISFKVDCDLERELNAFGDDCENKKKIELILLLLKPYFFITCLIGLSAPMSIYYSFFNIMNVNCIKKWIKNTLSHLIILTIKLEGRGNE